MILPALSFDTTHKVIYSFETKEGKCINAMHYMNNFCHWHWYHMVPGNRTMFVWLLFLLPILVAQHYFHTLQTVNLTINSTPPLQIFLKMYYSIGHYLYQTPSKICVKKTHRRLDVGEGIPRQRSGRVREAVRAGGEAESRGRCRLPLLGHCLLAKAC